MLTNVQLTPYLSMRPEDVSPELFCLFLKRFDRAGGNLKMIQDVANDPELVERLVHFFKEEDVKNRQTIRFTYEMQVMEMIAAGGYSSMDDHFRHLSDYRYLSEGEVRMPHLYDVRKAFYIKDLPKELEEHDLRSATLPELLLFGANNPEEQKNQRVYSFDSVVSEYLLTGLCFDKERGRGLQRYCDSGEYSNWSGLCHSRSKVAVVRK